MAKARSKHEAVVAGTDSSPRRPPRNHRESPAAILLGVRTTCTSHEGARLDKM
jgi:hypothetical protein